MVIGAKMFLILITPDMRIMIRRITTHLSGLKNKNQSLSRFAVQTLLATFVMLDDHSLGVRSFIQKISTVFS